MKAKKRKRSRQFSFVVSDAEYAQIEKLSARTTCTSVNDYARSVTLQQPVVVKIRHETAEEFLRLMIPLKMELEKAAAALTDFPQDHDPKILVEQIEELRLLMLQCYQQCTQ